MRRARGQPVRGRPSRKEGRSPMGALLSGIVVAIVLAVGIGAFLPAEPEPAWQVYSTTSVRVADPGTNLVGPEWTGWNRVRPRSEEHTSELQSLMRISYAVFCLKNNT